MRPLRQCVVHPHLGHRAALLVGHALPVGQKKREALLYELLGTLEDPSELTNADGLMKQLRGRMVEKSLQAELCEHLGTKRARGVGPRTLATGQRPRPG